MAVRINNFSEQIMIIGESYSLNVRITGNPENVRAEGLVDGLYYNWNSSRGRIQIRGTPERVVFNQQMIIYADDVLRRQNYSVYPLVPVLDSNITKTIVSGIPFSLQFGATNPFSYITMKGPLIGLKQRANPQGIMLYGTVPEDFNFTTTSFLFEVTCGNQAGTDEATIILNLVPFTGINFYILDGDGSAENTVVRKYPVAMPSGSSQSIQATKSIRLPSIPNATANYVAIATDGINLYLLHSKPQLSVTNRPADLDDQIVVISPNTADNSVAGIIRRFSITRSSNYYTHELDDFYYENGLLYILTSYSDDNSYASYYVRYPIDSPNTARIINLLERGGGIAVVGNLLTAVLYSMATPNQGNYFRIYPPSYLTGSPLIADSDQVYTTNNAIRSNFAYNTNDVSMTGVNNYIYILSSTLPSKITVLEMPSPIDRAINRGEITLNPALTMPQGITHL